MAGLGDILVAIVREMMGLPPIKEPPPRRRGDRGAPRRNTNAPPPEPPPKAMEPAYGPEFGPMYADQSVKPKRPRRQKPAQRQDVAPPAAAVISSVGLAATTEPEVLLGSLGEIADLSPIPGSGEPSILRSRTRRAPARVSDGFVERMRTDPQALRDALIASEILGPPLADRR